MDIESLKKPIAKWAWNEKLNTQDTMLNADKIIDCGFGGVCINARYGLQNKYMGEEWMRNISCAIRECDSYGAEKWICDDYAKVSGSANGVVNAQDLMHQQKFLRCESAEKSNDRTIIFKDGYHFYYDVNPYYVDVLNKDVTQQFIQNAYMPYIERFPQGIDTFLCYAPQLFSDSIPWSFTLPVEYKNTYGEELLDVLLELFRPVGNYINTRIKFYSLVSRLFGENFLKPIYDYCNEHNVSLALNLSSDSAPVALSMSQYYYSHFPCVENISRNDSCPLSSLSAASTAYQLGKKDSYALLFSSCGYGATFDDFKRIAQQMQVRGITGIISTGENLSLRGGRKYDNPSPSYFYGDNTDEYTMLNNYIARTGSLLSQGNADFETLVIYNSSCYWAKLDTENKEGTNDLSALMKATIDALEKKHIPFHIADELIVQKHARIEGDTFVLGNGRYKTVILTESSIFLDSTTTLLSEFESGGGFITMADSLSSNDICDNENLLYTYRSFPNHKIHYFVNNSPLEFTAAISVADKMIDISTGDTIPFYGIYKFAPYESIMLLDDGTLQQSRPFKKPLKTLDISGEWTASDINNVLVLDRCDVYFDNQVFCENENCADVIELAASLKRSVQIECVYNFNISEIPQEIFLACENSDSFTILINDTVIDKEYDGFFIDKALSRINISSYINLGENKISLKAFYSPSDEFLLSYEKALKAPSERNKLNYSLEISPLYIVGGFNIAFGGEFRKLDKNASRYLGDFSIDGKKEKFLLSHLEQQGLVFFCGELTFSKTFNISDTSYCIKFKPEGINSVTIEVNGKIAQTLMWQPFECDISDLLVKGDNEIKLTIRSTNRNLLGPHHIPMGELYEVTSGDFYKHPCVWNDNKPTPWENNYCFIEFGISERE